MKTIQINDFLTIKEQPMLEKLLQEIYRKFLKDDPDFHYLFEPQLIIRIENQETIEKIVSFLRKKNYLVEVYAYPDPKKNRYFGDEKGIVNQYSHIFLPLFHYVSKFYLDTKKEDHKYLQERIIHVSFNMDHKDYYEEAEILIRSGLGRAVVYGQTLGLQGIGYDGKKQK